MKKTLSIIIVLLLTLSLTTTALASDFQSGSLQGEMDAEDKHSTVGYWIGGTAASFILSPLFGGGATIALAYLTDPEPDTGDIYRLREEYPDEYIAGYRDGYRSNAKSQNVTAAWGSAGVGFLARLLVMSAAQSGSAQGTSEDFIPAVSFSF